MQIPTILGKGTKYVPFGQWVHGGKAAAAHLFKTGQEVYEYDTMG